MVADRSSRIEEEYDALRYPNVPVFKSHPDNLATLGRLFGLQPAPVPACRVLELGCGSAENLLPMAASLPDSELVGVDVSAAHLAEGRRRAEALSLANLKLLHRDLIDLDDSLGHFDYIICHGVFSWVAPPVQTKILSLCGELLTPAGIAYVSYNACPGWHLLAMLRGMLLRDAGDTAVDRSPLERVRAARETLAFLEHSAGMSHNPVAEALAPELRRLRSRSDGYLFHEYLTEHNQGFWFADFVAKAEEHGLRYLANAVPETMTPANYGQGIAQAVARVADPVPAQQKLDFALGRAFNSTLLCRAEQPVRRDLAPDVLDDLLFDAWIEPDPSEGDVHDSEPVVVHATSGSTARVTGADLRTALGVMCRARPLALPLDDVYRAVVEALPESAESADQRRHDLAMKLMRLYFGAVVGLTTYQRRMTCTVGACPTASPLARLQATEQDWVTNQWHQKVPLSARQRELLVTLDGSHEPDGSETLTYFARSGLLVA
jgi:SAM-dependent methyltransferase